MWSSRESYILAEHNSVSKVKRKSSATISNHFCKNDNSVVRSLTFFLIWFIKARALIYSWETVPSSKEEIIAKGKVSQPGKNSLWKLC